MEKITTIHYQNPLWVEKSIEQKRETLKQMFFDLNIYAQNKGIVLEPFDITDSENDEYYNNQRQKILEFYKEVLSDDLGIILSGLDNFIPHDEKEERDIKSIKKLVLENPNILNMNCEVGCLTGSGLVVNMDTKSVLLHLHKKFNKWFQFGGHPEYETNLKDVAKRETEEETNLLDLEVLGLKDGENTPVDIDLHEIPEKDNKPKHFHADFRYIFNTKFSGIPQVGTDESSNFRWIKFSEVDDYSEEEISKPLKRLIKKAERFVV